MLTVGQKLWFIPQERYQGDPCEVTVTKVGRQWAAVDGTSQSYRVDIDSLVMDSKGYGGVGRCYLSREMYESEKRRQTAWDNLQRRMGSWTTRLHPDVTVDDMQAAAKLLRLTAD